MATTQLPRSLRPTLTAAQRLATPPAPPLRPTAPRRWNSVSQRPGSDHILFPGAVNSKFTTHLSFSNPTAQSAMPTYRILDQNGALASPSNPPPSLSTPTILKLYTDMVTVSILDLIMFDSQRQGKISFYIVSAGEEGVAVGTASALSPADPIFTQYRETGVFTHRGFAPRDFMAQLFSTARDPGRGRNMPVHYGSSAALHIHSISSPVATQIPHAAGAAYAAKLRNARSPPDEQTVVACYFGEGAASEGDFHAGLNIAATRACPVVFVCRNNGFAISTSTLEQYRGDGIASRGTGYGIDTVRVDGNDVLAVHEVMRRARALALEDGGKPVLVEAMSYRLSHHSTSDNSFAYRARVEVEDWRRRDNPLTRLRKWMEGRGLWDEGREKALRADVRREVLDAYHEAEREKKPPLRCMMTDVYERVTEEQRSQMAGLRALLQAYPDEYDVSGFEEGLDGLKIDPEL